MKNGLTSSLQESQPLQFFQLHLVDQGVLACCKEWHQFLQGSAMVSDPGSSRAEAEIGGSPPTPRLLSDVLFDAAVPTTAAVARTKAAKEMLAAVILLFCVQNLDADVVIASVVLDTSG
jgi:hypothetical protein|mmetsp:Transcript_2510/g.4561  ORF Transcript_2510/g.4561 Transcript_2510/m.4561 type:complete len:119 (+) Transcript_2510:1969-2325(+)